MEDWMWITLIIVAIIAVIIRFVIQKPDHNRIRNLQNENTRLREGGDNNDGNGSRYQNPDGGHKATTFLSGGGITASSTDTLINKTINPTNNTMPYLGSYTFTLWKESGAVKCRNNKTGVVTSNTNIDPLINTILASGDPSFEVNAEVYNLSTGFTGFVVPINMQAHLQDNTWFLVKSGYTGVVWKYWPADTVVYYAKLTGGYYDEQSPQSNLWDGISIKPTTTGAAAGAVYSCTFRDMKFWRCNRPIHINTNGTSWANQNHFENIYSEACVYLGAYFEHTGTYTINQSGTDANLFINVSGQGTVVDAVNHYPNVLGGFIGVFGQRNMFIGCNPWDLFQVPAAISCSIGANALNTQIIGGMLADPSCNYSNAGKRTMVWDGYTGLSIAKEAKFYGREEAWSPAISIEKQATTGSFELVANIGVAGSVDTFTLENGTPNAGSFTPIWRSSQISTNSSPYLEGFHLQSLIKDADDSAGMGSDVPGIIFSGRRQTNTAGDADSYRFVTRPIFGIRNYNTDILKMWKDRLDLLGNKLSNFKLEYIEITASTYTLAAWDEFVKANAASNAITLTLPTATTRAGKNVLVKKTDTTTNIVTIDPNSTETIEGLDTWKLRYPNDSVEFRSNGTNWNVLSHSEYSYASFFRKGATANRRYVAGLMPNSTATLLTSTTAPTVGTLYALPFLVPELTKFDTITCQVTTLGAGSNVRMGIYADDGTDSYPGALIYDTGAISSASTGAKEATITLTAQTFQPGLYWVVYENSATAPQIRILPAVGGYYGIGGYDNTLSTTPAQYGWTVAHTFGALPNPLTGGGTAITTASAVGAPIPAVGLRPIL